MANYALNIQDVVDKRIASLQYLRDVQGGNIFWLNTIQISNSDFRNLSRDDSSKSPLNARDYFILGGSIPNLIESKSRNLTEYLNAFLLLLKEYKHLTAPPEAHSKPKIISSGVAQVGRRLFKSRSKHVSSLYSNSNGSSSNLASIGAELDESFSHGGAATSVTSNSQSMTNDRSSISSTYHFSGGTSNNPSIISHISGNSSSYDLKSSRPTSVISSSSLASLKSATNGFTRSKQRDSSASMISSSIGGTSFSSGVTSINGNHLNNLPSTSLISGGNNGNGANLIPTKEFPHLIICHLPFTPDMYETFMTLCEVLIEAYRRINTFLQIPNTATQITSNNNNLVVASHESYNILLKVDDHVKRYIIGPTVRGIDMLSKSVIYDETKRLDGILIHSK